MKGKNIIKFTNVKHEAAIGRAAWIAPHRTDKDVVAFLGEAWPRATALTRPSLLLERNPLRLNGVDPTPSLARG